MISNTTDLFLRLNTDGELKDETIDIGNNVIDFSVANRNEYRYTNCTITCGQINLINIHNPEFELHFTNCVLKTRIYIEKTQIKGLELFNISELQALIITSQSLDNTKNCSIDYFHFNYPDNNKTTINTSFHILGCIFTNEFRFENVNMIKGFNFISNNIFGVTRSPNKLFAFSFNNSKLKDVQFHNNKFNEDLNFCNTTFDYPTMNLTFHKNIFDSVFSINSNFNGYISFSSCVFNGPANFDSINTDDKTNFHIGDLEFNSSTTFNHSKINNLTISRTTFKEITSFQNTTFNSIFIDTTSFEKFVYFDDINIKNLSSCNRRTLRTIKQQLQKADNKIDYNRFRSYELAAYYRELKWYGNFKDKFILGATWVTTGFDHSWRQALVFTIISGMAWYSILYFTQYTGTFDIEEINTYFSGAFKFFLITDFSSPFKAKGEYFDLAINWLPLILGKIFIAFGIYEMIQAFRKFKA